MPAIRDYDAFSFRAATAFRETLIFVVGTGQAIPWGALYSQKYSVLNIDAMLT